MEIDKELIRKIQVGFEELWIIIEKKELNKDIVLDKLEEVIRNLDKLNSVSEKAIEEYQIQKSEWYSNSGLLEFILNDRPNLSQSANLKIDVYQMSILFAHEMTMESSQTRKKWLRKSKIIFRNLNLISKFVTIFIGFSFGFIVEKIGEYFFPKAPDYLIGIIVAIILYFTIEKKIDKATSNYFWEHAARETRILKTHLNIYAYQMMEIYKYLFKVNNIPFPE